jgi:hypothetical protein
MLSNFSLSTAFSVDRVFNFFKNTLDTLSIKLAFNPFDKELRQHCFTMSKKYNKLRNAKRCAYYSDMMFKLNSLSDTNPKAFSDLVNELKYEKKTALAFFFYLFCSLRDFLCGNGKIQLIHKIFRPVNLKKAFKFY